MSYEMMSDLLNIQVVYFEPLGGLFILRGEVLYD